MKKYVLFIIIMVSITTHAISLENNSISGTIIDARTKDPLIGVNVIVLDTERGASTDISGRYIISNLPVGVYRLRFDYIGYEQIFKTDIVVKSSRPTFVNVELEESVIAGEEIVVTAGYFVEEEKTQTSTIALSQEEIRRFPGGFEDVVRTVSTLPGVAINTSGGRNDLLVRGGGPSENLYLINNIEVPNINHFGTQGNSSGSLSFVNLDLVEDVKFSTGGFGAQYGDKMSSILSLKMIDQNPNNIESKLTVSATQYGFNVQTPVPGNGNFIFSARRSYLDLIFRAAGLPFVPVYTDFNLIANYDLSGRDRLFLIGLSAINEVDRDQSSLENRVSNASLLDNSQYQAITGLNYRRLLDRGYLDLTLSTNLFRYRFNQINENEEEYFKSDADEREHLLKLQHFWLFNKRFGVLSGASMKYIQNDNNTAFADTIYDRSGNRIPFANLGVAQNTSINADAQKYAAFLETEWEPTNLLTVNAGIRLDYYSFLNKKAYWGPRLSLKYKLLPRHSIRLSGGVYHQSPSYVWVANPNNKKLTALTNNMIVLGWDFLARNDVRLSIESYYKKYQDLPSGVSPGITDFIVINNTGTGFGGRQDNFRSFGYFELSSTAEGEAYGAEFLVQKKFSEIPLYGLFSLSYCKSEVVANNGISYPNQYDQRFIFNLSGGYILNSKWEFAAKFRYYTGVPYTPIYKPDENPSNPGSIENLPDEYLTARLDAGHHLDIRVDRYFNFSTWTLILYVDIQNVYDYKIPQRPSYDFWNNEITNSSDIGLLPSIGISLEL